MCHKAVFHVFFSPSHSSQACCKWIPHVVQASEKEQSDLVSHPAAVQAADSDPGPALPALTLHFLQSGLMTLSLGSASASGLGCGSLSQETSTPFTALPEWPGRLNPCGPALIPTEGCCATRSSTNTEEPLFTESKPLSFGCSCNLGFWIFSKEEYSGNRRTKRPFGI